MTEHAILDICCGSRMFWFTNQDTRAVFADIRAEEHDLCYGHRLVISLRVIAKKRRFSDGKIRTKLQSEMVTIDGGSSITYCYSDG